MRCLGQPLCKLGTFGFRAAHANVPWSCHGTWFVTSMGNGSRISGGLFEWSSSVVPTPRPPTLGVQTTALPFPPEHRPLRTTLQIIFVSSAPPASSQSCLFVTCCTCCHQLSPMALCEELETGTQLLWRSNPPHGGLCNNMRGKRRNSFHPVLGGTSPSLWPLPMQIGTRSGTALPRLVGRASSPQPRFLTNSCGDHASRDTRTSRNGRRWGTVNLTDSS